MEQGNTLQKDIDSFDAAIKQLSAAIKKCNANWKDDQYAKISASISTIASSSKQVMTAGAACNSAISRFKKAESE